VAEETVHNKQFEEPALVRAAQAVRFAMHELSG